MKFSFLDFWDGFQPNNNFFIDLFREILGDGVEVSPPQEADVIIYSCFGRQNHRSFDKDKVIKIFYTGENLRPNYKECTYSFTFDFDDYQGRNIRIPLWLLQLDWYDKKDYENPKYVIPLTDLEKNQFTSIPKTKFCALINNNLFDNRVECMKKLSTYKAVDGFGKHFGNWFYGEKRKMEILSSYRFSICFENTMSPGYYTEKLIHSKLSGNIPLYWADDRIAEDFNTEAFLNLSKFGSMDQLVQAAIQIDQNEEAYNHLSNQPLWKNPKDPFNKKEEIKDRVKSLLKI